MRLSKSLKQPWALFRLQYVNRLLVDLLRTIKATPVT